MENLIAELKEVHPHIAIKVELLWGTEELDVYLSKLLLDTRDGQRQGFQPNVATLLMLLQDLNDLQLPEKRKIEFDYSI